MVAMLEDEARASTGLDFVNPTHRDALEVFLDNLRCVGLSARHEDIARRHLVKHLAIRLRCREHLRTHPELAATPVRAPIFVVGKPRTGTTLLLELLASDPQMRSLRSWELSSPVRAVTPGRKSEAIHRTELSLRLLEAASPGLERVHRQSALGSAECNPLFACDARRIEVAMLYRLKAYYDWLHEDGLRSAYEFHREVLQLLQLGRSDSWVLKSAFHLAALGALTQTYPDAVLLCTHRDPRQVVASTASLTFHMRRAILGRADPEQCGRDALDFVADLARWMHEFRCSNPGQRVIDVRYDELLRNPVATVAGIHRELGRDFGRVQEETARGWLADHPQHAYGRHRYSLEVFGLSERQVEERLAWYRRAYDIRDEASG